MSASHFFIAFFLFNFLLEKTKSFQPLSNKKIRPQPDYIIHNVSVQLLG